MLSYSEMLFLCREVGPVLQGLRFLFCTEVGEKRWVIGFEGGKRLLICAKRPWNRFHLTSRSLKGTSTPFTEGVEKRLSQGVLTGIEMLGEDRILCLVFAVEKTEVLFVCELCLKHPKVFLMDREMRVLWPEGKEKEYRFPEKKGKVDLQPVVCTSEAVDQKYEQLEQAAELEERIERVRKQLEGRLKKCIQRLQQLEGDLHSEGAWEEQMHRAELLKSVYGQLKRGMKEIAVSDWMQEGQEVVIPLDPTLDPADQLKKPYQMARKMKRRRELAAGFIASVQQEKTEIETFLRALEAAQSVEALSLLEEKMGIQNRMQAAPVKTKAVSHPFREFTTASGLAIYVGKKDRDNDALTFQFAKGLDWWFHVDSLPGSHVILRVPKGGQVDGEALQDALQLALYFSQGRNKGAQDVVYTECKHVAKPRGAPPGQVTLSRRKTVRVRPDPERLERLLKKQPFPL